MYILVAAAQVLQGVAILQICKIKYFRAVSAQNEHGFKIQCVNRYVINLNVLKRWKVGNFKFCQYLPE